ncbi:MAG: D-2-hydroxyacid dehydrogenase [Clostridia bacterium]|nr:D-2-hydroxyacid dehydrogenase [Clostridia bacterium]
MKTVVLDGYGVNPGDLSWQWLSGSGEYEVYERTGEKDVYERTKDADAVIINKIVFDKPLIDRLPKLKYIGITATGYNVVDTEYAYKKGIIVTNVPAYSTESVAQHTFTLMLELMNRASVHNESVKNGKWSSNADFCYWLSPQIELCGKTLGLIGSGKIGTRVAEIAKAFGMNVIMTGSTMKEGRVSLDKVLSQSNIISLHCPMNKDTDKIINKENISKMRDGVYIINTSRGGLIDEKAVSDALIHGKIKGFAADVLSCEPPKSDNPLLAAPNTLITPHLAWATFEARTRLMKVVKENLENFLKGNIQNQVI